MAGQGNLYKDKTAIFKHRQWRGLKDTWYDYTQWLKLWYLLAAWFLKHPIQNVKALFRYRWMFTYLTVPSFFDRMMASMRGAALRAARNNMNTLVIEVTQMLTDLFTADLNLHPGSKKAEEAGKKIIILDELVPILLVKGFKGYKVILQQEFAAYLPSLINQHSPVHYIEQSESYGLPADVCPLPSLEAGIAIEDDYPKIAAPCFISCNMPCDGSIMTSALQDRRHGLKSHALNIPLRWKRENVQQYAIAEYMDCIRFIEEQTGVSYDWDVLKEAVEIYNRQTRLKMEKWELNMTDISPHTGATAWLYRIFEYQAACGSEIALKNDEKVNAILRKQVSENKFPKTVRHRAILWNTPANMYANLNAWLLDCWGIDSVAEMIDFQGSEIIDTSSKESMLAGIAKMAQGATMRVHTKGGYHVILDDLWVKYEQFHADMIIMFDQISCKGVGAISGLFEEEARRRGVHFVWLPQDLMDPTTISRRSMRDHINAYMATVMKEKPLDPTLVDFDDSESW